MFRQKCTVLTAIPFLTMPKINSQHCRMYSRSQCKLCLLFVARLLLKTALIKMTLVCVCVCPYPISVLYCVAFKDIKVTRLGTETYGSAV